jgi:hypothetical protein
MTIRALLDHGCMTMVVRDTELAEALEKLGRKPDLVITDSQAFGKVSKIVPREIPLTSFSILMARYKGNLEQVIAGVSMLDRIEDGDKILISEGCTHHRQCNDIGTVKLPGWIKDYTKKEARKRGLHSQMQKGTKNGNPAFAGFPTLKIMILLA